MMLRRNQIQLVRHTNCNTLYQGGYMKFKKLTDKQFNTLVKIFVIFALAYFISGVAMAEPIKVAVLETGYDFKSTWSKSTVKPKLCAEGHKDFTEDTIQDTHGHGTHIAGIIAQNNQLIDYCLVIVKVFDPLHKEYNKLNVVTAFKYAVDIGADIINYSGGGVGREDIECTILNYALGRGVKVVAAAGNEHSDLTVKPYYPAMCDPRIYKIAAKTANNERLPASNYTVKHIPNLFWELGQNVMSLLPNNTTGVMSGTSQATAIFTQKLVRRLYMYRIEQAIKLNRIA